MTRRRGSERRRVPHHRATEHFYDETKKEDEDEV